MIKKAMVALQGEGETGLYEMDVIDYEGEPWLVPEWLQNTAEGWMRPTRIIRLRGLQFEATSGWIGDYLVNSPIPRAVIEGHASPESEQYVVVERPDIRVPTGGVQ